MFLWPMCEKNLREVGGGSSETDQKYNIKKFIYRQQNRKKIIWATFLHTANVSSVHLLQTTLYVNSMNANVFMNNCLVVCVLCPVETGIPSVHCKWKTLILACLITMRACWLSLFKTCWWNTCICILHIDTADVCQYFKNIYDLKLVHI